MSEFHLAQINIAQARDTMESETMRGFVERLDEINALADRSPGFVWRLQTPEGNATTIEAFDDPRLIVNMSVWENMASLKNYVYKSVHVELIRDRDAWFTKLKNVHQVLWWVRAGEIPTVKEGREKLDLLQEIGPNSEAFTFAKPHAQPISRVAFE